MSLFSRFLFSLAVLSAACPAYVGKWHSFTNKDRVTSLASHQGFIYAGTQGGVRRVNPVTLEEADYDNLDGLLDCWITGLTETSDRKLWAVSRSGYVYMLSGSRWQAFGRSYAADQWLMNDRAVVAVGSF